MRELLHIVKSEAGKDIAERRKEIRKWRKSINTWIDAIVGNTLLVRSYDKDNKQ